jgi:hypothetical protein
MGALVGALIAIFHNRNHELAGYKRPFQLTGSIFGPFGGSTEETLQPSSYAVQLWQAIQKIQELSIHVGNAPDDPDELAQWTNDLAMKLEAEYELGAFMTAIPLALASLPWSDELVESIRQRVFERYADSVESEWALPAMWIYFVMLRAAMLKNDPIKAARAAVKELDPGIRDEFRVCTGQGWSPTLEPATKNISMNCLINVVWIIRYANDPKSAFHIVPQGRGIQEASLMLTRLMAGALIGAIHGIHRLPSSMTTHARLVRKEGFKLFGTYQVPESYLEDKLTTIGLWELQNIALALAGFPPVREAELEPGVGPESVAEGLFAANLMGALDAPTEWCVVSLCRTGDRFKFHAHRRQIYLIDKEGDINPDLAAVVQDAVDAIDLHLSQGRPVVVHCHGGRSRTGLILKAWKMRKDGIDEQAAHEWLKASWPLVNRSNQTFIDFLRNEWPKVMKDFEND